MSYRGADDSVGMNYKYYPPNTRSAANHRVYHNLPSSYGENCGQQIISHSYTVPVSQMHELYHNHSHPSQPSPAPHLSPNQNWDLYTQNHRLEGYVSGVPGLNYSPSAPSYPVHRFSATKVQQAPQSIPPNIRPVHSDLYTGTQHSLAGSLDPTTGIFYRTPEHPRLRTAQACEKCRTRKAKCSGEHPSCKRCLNRGLMCEYAKEGRVRGPNKPKPKVPVRPASSSPLMLQSQSTVPAPRIDISVSNSTEASVPRRYVSPSVLPPSMSLSLSCPSSPHNSSSFDALNSPIPSSSSSDSNINSHNPSDSGSLPEIRHAKRKPSNLQLTNGYREMSEYWSPRHSGRLEAVSHVPPLYSQPYMGATIQPFAYSDRDGSPVYRDAILMSALHCTTVINSLVHPDEMTRSEGQESGTSILYHSDPPKSSVFVQEIQRPRSYDSFSTSHIHQSYPSYHSQENLGELSYPADVGE